MNKVKYIRTQAGLTQQQFAKKFFISRAAVSHYETGRRRPHYKIAYKIIRFAKAKKFKITLEDILSQ